MKTIKNNVKNELIIKNSRFITLLIKITSKDEVNKILDDLKKEYPKATHYCYGYIIDDYKKSSDDKEPSNTAGIPTLNILEKEDLTNVLAVTIRYFGGIKLGVGGLIRAYSKSVQEALTKIELVELKKAKLIELTINYDKQKQLDYLLKDEIIIEKSFDTNITYNVLIEDKNIEKISNYTYKIIKDSTIEKS